uniref:Uncharacterized protein n=1 Tax=Hyaloperonospora arabidopsidis (strain Emoy2) TaxID=559515 RepID=M4BX21_HYAAE
MFLLSLFDCDREQLFMRQETRSALGLGPTQNGFLSLARTFPYPSDTFYALPSETTASADGPTVLAARPRTPIAPPMARIEAQKIDQYDSLPQVPSA